jgi:hypothetical protein
MAKGKVTSSGSSPSGSSPSYRDVMESSPSDLSLSLSPSGFDEHDLMKPERENMMMLLEDVSLDITHNHYTLIREKLNLYLSHCYKDEEIMGELGLTERQFANFKDKVPLELWQKYRNQAYKWLGRKRSRAMTRETGNDYMILQALDKEFNPKLHIEQENITPELTEEERKQLRKVFGEGSGLESSEGGED